MSTPQKMQYYMERHRINSLFEDLMNKVLHEQPDDPIIFMIRSLYKKAGMDIPTELKMGGHGLRRSSPERIIRRSKSPEMSKKAGTQAWGSNSADFGKDRDYNKPWLSHSKKVRGTPEAKEEKESAHKGGRRQKTEWNSDTKVKASAFDDLFEEDVTGKTKQQAGKTETDPRKAWASVGLNGTEDVYQSRNYSGPRSRRGEEEDPLAGELDIVRGVETEKEKVAVSSNVRVKGRNVDKKKHRQDLEKLLNDRSSDDSGYMEDKDLEQEDDAIELLEDGDELAKEGARHISKSGYKLGRIMRGREQEANVKLNIHLYPRPIPGDSLVAEDTGYRQGRDEEYDYDEDERPPTGMSGYQVSPGESDLDEEFESVSQVTGPRRPVWNVDDSDGETFQPKVSKTLPQPVRSSNRKETSQRQKLASTTPVRFEESPYPSRSIESADSFLQGGQPWSPEPNQEKDIPQPSVRESLRSESGGWQLPRYDSETSIADWSTTTGKATDRNGQPRAY